MPHADTRTRNRAVLRLDALEPREVPAASAYLADAGHTLVISGSDVPDVVSVIQNDRSGTLTVSGVGAAPITYAAARIGTVQVSLRGGDDRFEYSTRGDVRIAKQLRIDAGGGDDTVVVHWADDGATAQAGLTAVVAGGDGSDALGFRVGSLAAGVTVNIRADGGTGNDAIGLQAVAPGRAATLDAALRGGTGDDSLTVYSTGDRAAGGRASFDLSGGTGDDVISTNVAGLIAGAFDVRADGGAGNDQLALVATDAIGPGKVRATLLGGDGDDQFATIADGRTADVLADGGTGANTGLLIPGVRATNVQQSRVPTNYELHPGPLPTFNPVLPTRTIQRDGRTVEYYSAGTSKPGQPVVVLLTGFGGDIDYWQTVPAQLARGSQVIAVNRPGYRQSSTTTGDYAQTAIDDIRAVVRAAADGRPVVLVGHSLGGLYADLYARLHPNEVAGVVFVDATAPEVVARVADFGVPFGGLGDPADPLLRLQQPGVRQEIEGVVSLTGQVLAAGAFPLVPVVSLRAGPAELFADDPQGDAWYQALGALGSPGETRRMTDSGHNIQYDRLDAVTRAVADVLGEVARSADRRFVSSVLADAAGKYGIPGLTAAVIDTRGVVTGAAGVRQQGITDPVRAGDLFQNGSTTKAMTATLAGVLVDRGLIRWDTTIADVFPELLSVMRPEYRGVTLETLLQHRGGILADEDASPQLTAAVAALDPTDPRAARAAILPLVLKEPPHTAGEFHYSNGGYTVVGAMLERVTGTAYEDLMRRYVFDPLGMASATYGVPPAGQPVGHDPAGNPVPYGSDAYLATDVPALDPAGANLRMSVGDWAKFVRVHMGQTVNGVRLLTPATLARLHTPAFPDLSPEAPGANYAAGWTTFPAGFGGADPALGAFLNHTGSDGFWLAEVQAYPSRQFAVLIMANAEQTAGGQDLGVAFADIKARLTERFEPPTAPAALPLSSAVRDVVTQVRAATGVPAVAAGVIVDGHTAGLAAVGVQKAGTSTPVGDDTRFHIGSNAKSMTATLAATLVERGVIRWDTTVGQMFPELRSGLRPGYADVTLEELLNHRGGVGDFTTEADVATYERFQKAARFPMEGRQSYLRYWLTTVPPVGPRGEFHYPNVGYTLAGAMLERAANRSFETLLTDNLFRPLGMASVAFGTPVGSKLPDLLSPSGGVSMTMADWGKYLRMQLGEPANGVRLLSDASLLKLHTPDPRPITDESGTYRYGFGWRTADTPLGEALGHEGAVPGYYSRVGIIPSLKLAVFSAVNDLSDAAVAANQQVTDGLLARVITG